MSVPKNGPRLETAPTKRISSTSNTAGISTNVVVNDFIAGLNNSGGRVIKNISVIGVSGTTAIPDGASLPNGWTKPYFIEVIGTLRLKADHPLYVTIHDEGFAISKRSIRDRISLVKSNSLFSTLGFRMIGFEMNCD